MMSAAVSRPTERRTTSSPAPDLGLSPEVLADWRRRLAAEPTVSNSPHPARKQPERGPLYIVTPASNRVWPLRPATGEANSFARI